MLGAAGGGPLARRVRGAGLALLLLGAEPAGAATVTQWFIVEVPEATPDGAAIWISGDLPALGAWNGEGVRLAPAGPRRFQAGVELERGTPFEFKVTRGGWETVEKDAAGGEMANRRAVAGAADTVPLRVASWRDQTADRATRAPTLTGDVRRLPDFPSRHVRSRDVLVWLPPGYDDDTTRRYPVLYFHDGNNVFDAATSFLGVEWGLDETADRLIRAGSLAPFIAVAVYNTPDRMSEYTPAADPKHGGGRSEAYERFLLEELKPVLDRAYRTLPDAAHTGLVGSSLGALVSVDAALRHPEAVGLVGCLSPAAWWAGRDLVTRVQRFARAGSFRVWVDIGTAEGTATAGHGEWLEDARALRDALVAKGWREGEDLHYEEVAGAVHDERAWAARLDRVLLFLVGPPGGR